MEDTQSSIRREYELSLVNLTKEFEEKVSRFDETETEKEELYLYLKNL